MSAPTRPFRSTRMRRLDERGAQENPEKARHEGHPGGEQAAQGAGDLIEELRAQIERLTRRVAELELELAKAKKVSSTSSKPPSSDIVKPPPKKRPGVMIVEC